MSVAQDELRWGLMRAEPRNASGDLWDVDGYAEKLIRFRARQLVGRYGFTGAEREDLEQELRLDLLRRITRFRPERASRNTFVARVVDHAVATIIERQTAACRDGRRTQLFADCTLEDGKGKALPFEDSFDAAEYLRLTGRVDSESTENIDRRANVEEAAASMPVHLRELLSQLLTSSVTEVSRVTRIPRATLYARIREIRAHLERAGLRDYLQSSGSFPNTPVCK